MAREIKTTLKLDGEAAFNKGLQSIDREMRVLDSQLGALTSAYDKNEKSIGSLTAQTDLLQKKQEASRSKVKALESAVSDSEAAYHTALRAVSKFTDEQLRTEEAGILAAQALEKAEKTMDGYRIKLANAQKQLNKNTQELHENARAIEAAEKAAEEEAKALLETARAAEEAEKTVKSSRAERVLNQITEQAEKLAQKLQPVIRRMQDLAGAAAKITLKTAEKSVKAFADTTAAAMAASVKAFTAYMGAITGAAGAMLSAAESSREYRMDMSKLEQAANSSGNSFQQMKSNLADLTALTGEADSSIEALNNLMAADLSDNQIARALESLSGAVIKFPDTLKIESLADSLQETLAQGEATGQFGELLERLGYDLESFNAELAACTSTAERQQYALDFLAKTGLAEVNAEYQKANAAALAYEKSQLQLEDSIAKMGEAVLPAATKIKVFSANLISALAGMVSGAAGASTAVSMNIKRIVDEVGSAAEEHAARLITGLNTVILTIVSAVNTSLPDVIGTMLPVLLAGFFGLVDGLIAELPTLAPNLAEGALALFSGLMSGLEAASGKLLPMLPEIVSGATASIERHAPLFLNSALAFFGNLLTGFADTVDLLVPKIPPFIETVSSKIISNLPVLIRTTVRVITTVMSTLIENLPLIVAAAIQIIETLADTLITPQNIQLIIETTFSLLKTITDTLIENLDKIIAAAMSIVTTLCTTLLTAENVTLLITTGLEILIKLVSAIADNIDLVFEAADTIITSLAAELTTPENIQEMINLGIRLLDEITIGLCKVVGKFGIFVHNMQVELWNTVMSTDWAQIGSDILNGIINGLLNSSMLSNQLLGSAASNLVSGLQSVLGIHSPSTVARDKIGVHLGDGVAVGFIDALHKSEKDMANAIPTDFDAGKIRFSFNADAAAGEAQARIAEIAAQVQQKIEQTIRVVVDPVLEVRYADAVRRMELSQLPAAAQKQSSQRTVNLYTYVTIENAKLDSDRDIQETAEELAAEQNRILAGVGKEG